MEEQKNKNKDILHGAGVFTAIGMGIGLTIGLFNGGWYWLSILGLGIIGRIVDAQFTW